MKILKEALLISPSQVSAINTKKGKDWTVAAIQALRTLYSADYNKYIDTNNNANNKVTDLILAIKRYGWDTDNNKYLLLIDTLISNGKQLTQQAYATGGQLLQAADDVTLAGNPWFLEQSSYNPLFKAKALAFLSSRKALAFGDDPEQAIADITPMTDQKDIENYLTNWQTKSGEGYGKEETIIKLIMRLPADFFDAAVLGAAKTFLSKVTKKEDFSTGDGKEVIKQLLLHADDTSEYGDTIKKLIKAEDSYWKSRYEQFIRQLYRETAEEKAADTRNYIKDLLINIFENASSSGKFTKTGLELLKKRIKETSGIDIDDADAVVEAVKYFKKLDAYTTLSADKVTAVDDYFGETANVKNILNAKYKDLDDFDTKVSNLITTTASA